VGHKKREFLCFFAFNYLSNLNRFLKKNFTARNSKMFATKIIQCLPTHLKYVAALSCKVQIGCKSVRKCKQNATKIGGQQTAPASMK